MVAGLFATALWQKSVGPLRGPFAVGGHVIFSVDSFEMMGGEA